MFAERGKKSSQIVASEKNAEGYKLLEEFVRCTRLQDLWWLIGDCKVDASEKEVMI